MLQTQSSDIDWEAKIWKYTERSKPPEVLAAQAFFEVCQRGYGFGRRHSCGSSCSCGPARCSRMLELVRTMARSIGVTSYVQEVGRLTDEVARATSSGYIRGSRAASFGTVRLVARASSCPSHHCIYQITVF